MLSRHVHEVLSKAEGIVRRGFVTDRKCHAVEDRDGNIVPPESSQAFRMTPSAAILFAENQILRSGKSTQAKADAVGKALEALTAAASPRSVDDLYRRAKDIDVVLDLFATARDGLWSSLAASQGESQSAFSGM